jgi:heat shock protein HspQ
MMAPEFQFDVGQVVHHKRYDYRGVVYAIDPQCLAPDSWYLRNRTQPDRAQPWYHVLVHTGDKGGQAMETYVAQENLESGLDNEPIEHPLIPIYFTAFIKGRYSLRSLN